MTELRILGERAAILAADDVQYDVVPTPEWGAGSGVRVRGLTSGELERYQNSMTTEKLIDKVIHRVNTNDGKSRARLMVMGIVNASGAQMFADDDVEKLNAKSSAAAERITDKILELSRAKAGDAAKLGEASGGTASAGSGSASPSPSAAPSPS